MKRSDTLDEDLIPRGDMVVTFSSKGYVKRVPANLYKSQRPGGKGRIGTKAASEDVVNQILYASSHDVLLCFSNRGRSTGCECSSFRKKDLTAEGRP